MTERSSARIRDGLISTAGHGWGGAAESREPDVQGYHRATRICGVATAMIGLAALAGWLTGVRVLTGIRPEFIPMAPNSALAFIILGSVLCALAPPQGRRIG